MRQKKKKKNALDLNSSTYEHGKMVQFSNTSEALIMYILYQFPSALCCKIVLCNIYPGLLSLLKYLNNVPFFYNLRRPSHSFL